MDWIGILVTGITLVLWSAPRNRSKNEVSKTQDFLSSTDDRLWRRRPASYPAYQTSAISASALSCTVVCV
jgi:hypothetical protein